MGKKRMRGIGPRPGNSTQSAKGPACPYCGKRSYSSRKYAKEANRRLYPEERMSTYRCREAPDFVDTSQLWHIGHLGQAVVTGRASRHQVHGSERLEMARPAPRNPFPSVLRAIVPGKGDESPQAEDNDDR